jgi:hypothetical protein
MKRLLVTMSDETHEGLRELAFRKKTTMSRLVIAAVEDIYEDDLDAIEAQKGLDDFLDDPERGISIEDYIAKRRSAIRS